MLQTFSFDGAGRIINMQASYFRYESGSAGGANESVRVRADGQDLGEYFPGDSIKLPLQAVAWEITPLSSNCFGRVRLGVGAVESSRLVGRVSVLDDFADSMAVAASAAPLTTHAYASDAIVTPAQNVRGLILRWANTSSRAGAGGSAYIGINCAKSAPTDYSIPLQRYPVLGAYADTTVLVDKSVTMNKMVPPGWGLYFSHQVLGAAATACGAQVGYELL